MSCVWWWWPTGYWRIVVQWIDERQQMVGDDGKRTDGWTCFINGKTGKWHVFSLSLLFVYIFMWRFCFCLEFLQYLFSTYLPLYSDIFTSTKKIIDREWMKITQYNSSRSPQRSVLLCMCSLCEHMNDVDRPFDLLLFLIIGNIYELYPVNNVFDCIWKYRNLYEFYSSTISTTIWIVICKINPKIYNSPVDYK